MTAAGSTLTATLGPGNPTQPAPLDSPDEVTGAARPRPGPEITYAVDDPVLLTQGPHAVRGIAWVARTAAAKARTVSLPVLCVFTARASEPVTISSATGSADRRDHARRPR